MEFAFERQAMRGEPVPRGLDVADTSAYIALKYLYLSYKNGLISQKDAKQEKQSIIYNWTAEKSKVEFLNRQSESLKNRIKAASEEYKNNPTIENADRLYAAFYGLGDDWRSK